MKIYFLAEIDDQTNTGVEVWENKNWSNVEQKIQTAFVDHELRRVRVKEVWDENGKRLGVLQNLT